MTTITRSALTAVAVAAIAAGSAGLAGAHGDMPSGSAPSAMPAKKTAVTKKNIVVTNPTVRVVPPGSRNTAGYMSIRSVRVADALVSASVPSSLAMKTELHLSTVNPETGQMMMVQQKRIGIPRNKTRQLKMGGYHVMIIGLKRDITAGMKVPITLKFLRAGTVKVTAVAREI